MFEELVRKIIIKENDLDVEPEFLGKENNVLIYKTDKNYRNGKGYTSFVQLDDSITNFVTALQKSGKFSDILLKAGFKGFIMEVNLRQPESLVWQTIYNTKNARSFGSALSYKYFLKCQRL